MNFKPVRTYDHYINAHLQLQQLQEEGIRAYLQDEYSVTVAPQFSHAIGGIKLMVDSLQLETAKQLLDKIDEEYRNSVACPQCDAKTIERELKMNAPTNWFTAIFSWLMGSYAVAPEQQYKCTQCGHVMKELPPAPENN